MFNAKQTRLMNTLGIVSDRDRDNAYDAYCEICCEMSGEDESVGTFTEYLERQVAVAAYLAKRNNDKALA